MDAITLVHEGTHVLQTVIDEEEAWTNEIAFVNEVRAYFYRNNGNGEYQTELEEMDSIQDIYTGPGFAFADVVELPDGSRTVVVRNEDFQTFLHSGIYGNVDPVGDYYGVRAQFVF